VVVLERAVVGEVFALAGDVAKQLAERGGGFDGLDQYLTALGESQRLVEDDGAIPDVAAISHGT
jgi:hypothetical protein